MRIATSSPPTRTRRVPVPRGLAARGRRRRTRRESSTEDAARRWRGDAREEGGRDGGGGLEGRGRSGSCSGTSRTGALRGGSIPVLRTARIDRPDAAVVSVVVVAVRGFALRTRFRDRQWRADSRGDEEDARVAHAPRRVLIVAVTLSHVELPLACRAGTTGRAEAGRVESFISFLFWAKKGT